MKHIPVDNNLEQELNQGMLELKHSTFDMNNHSDLTINSLSESGSITPSTLEWEFTCNTDFLKQLEEESKIQKDNISKMLKSYNFQSLYEKNNDRASEIEKTKQDSQNNIKTSSSLEQMKTTSEIREINEKLNEEKKILVSKLDDIILDNRSLSGMHKQLESFNVNDYKDVIALKTYQEDDKSNNVNTQVKRFALIAENLTKFIKAPLNPSVLHPLEIVLFKNALLELKNSSKKSDGVVCDIFVRGDKHEINETTIEGNKKVPETHSIVLWKENNEIIMLDPSNDKFSSPLIKDITRLAKLFSFGKVTSGIEGVLYGHDGKKVGRQDDNSRDCIDIAAKIVLELNYQTNSFSNKDMKSKIKDTCTQLSTENKYTKHFLKEANKQLRELRSTSSETRHFTLKILQNYLLNAKITK